MDHFIFYIMALTSLTNNVWGRYGRRNISNLHEGDPKVLPLVGKIFKGLSIDLSAKMMPKFLPRNSSVEKLESSATVNSVNTSITASSGGYAGSVSKGYLGAGGVAKASVDMKLNKGRGIDVKVQLPSGKAHAGPVAASIDLSGEVEAGLSKNRKNFKAGIDGPEASVKVGPVKLSVNPGLGVEVFTDDKKKVGGKLETPIGSFGGVKTGCSLEVCLILCVRVNVC